MSPPNKSGFPRVALFDLDGTLLDSAPDMLATANAMRTARGLPPLVLEQLRPQVSKGARAMIGVALPELDEAGRLAHVPEFLEIYRRELGLHGAAFPGVEAVLQALEEAGSRWGIVTNKPEGLARAAVDALGWSRRCAVLIGGDTLPERKPHPLPLQVAAQRLGVAVGDCVYVGDDVRDIESARAAGMRSIAALWGYRPVEDDPARWQADVQAARPGLLASPDLWPR